LAVGRQTAALVRGVSSARTAMIFPSQVRFSERASLRKGIVGVKQFTQSLVKSADVVLAANVGRH
jgi:hypothetical protein